MGDSKDLGKLSLLSSLVERHFPAMTSMYSENALKEFCGFLFEEFFFCQELNAFWNGIMMLSVHIQLKIVIVQEIEVSLFSTYFSTICRD